MNTTTTDAGELAPCPKCGRQPRENSRTGSFGFICMGDGKIPGTLHRLQVYGATRAEAITAWNTRPTQADNVLLSAAVGLRDDLLDRARWDGETKVVVAGNGAWFRFNEAIDAALKASPTTEPNPEGPTDAFHLTCPNCQQAIDLIPSPNPEGMKVAELDEDLVYEIGKKVADSCAAKNGSDAHTRIWLAAQMGAREMFRSLSTLTDTPEHDQEKG